MATAQHLRSVNSGGSAGVGIAEAISAFLRWMASKRGRSGRTTSPQTLRSYASALPAAFAGIVTVDEPGGQRLRANVHTAWGDKAATTFNAKRAAVASALSYFTRESWLPSGTDSLSGLDREPEPKPADRVRDRAAIDRLLRSKTHPLAARALWSLLYSTAARCEEVLALDIGDMDRADRDLFRTPYVLARSTLRCCQADHSRRIQAGRAI